jgi:uncharacterized protein
MKIFFLTLTLIPLIVLADGGLPSQPYIYIEGKASVEKPADMAVLHFEVAARRPDESKANAEVQAKANKIFDLAKTRGIAKDDVIAESLSSAPQYEDESTYQKKGKIIGYAVSRRFDIKLRDVQTFPKLVDDIIALGGIDFSSIEGDLQKREDLEEELQEKALANARSEAEKTARSQGMKIDSVYVISPAPIADITSTMFPKDRTDNSEVERVIVTGSNIPTAEEIGPRPSQYHMAPITATQIVHVIYLVSAAK